ncbi:MULTISPECIES: TetR/AcrR family transcriptional regulator [unclassified Uliginosibacterium]|uniref:TetR/AcrR family transcriptional regulator n=1 Tax=unclassified Uliginosibacterium TaxID=2621521 RepID=UPI000C7BA0A1|nr:MULTISPECIES: TetR/AcrR family transcriptional regulator [unclassified Uliginosibacterium]MDO6384735.1 TetR/AcrR family transcriptional regulator [Uliginosibacterium sp. 31-12]PLK48428.1 TetR family transcriptional regulator [Uliginosibacterium sp. TH139]
MNTTKSPATGTAQPRQPLDRDAWINFALSVLAEDGLEGLRVEVLARRLNVTKGSFYWHFKDRQALLNAVAAHWRDLRIAEVEAQASIAPQQAREQIHAVINQYATQPNQIRMRMELAIRDWARRDALVAAAVEAVDQARLRNSTRLFELAGFSAEEAYTRALLTFTHVFGLSMMMFEESISTDIASRHTAIATLITR